MASIILNRKSLTRSMPLSHTGTMKARNAQYAIIGNDHQPQQIDVIKVIHQVWQVLHSHIFNNG